MKHAKIYIVLAACIIVSFVTTNFYVPYYLSDKAKLDRGEISLFDYCSRLGHYAVNETKCKSFVKEYGYYNPF